MTPTTKLRFVKRGKKMLNLPVSGGTDVYQVIPAWDQLILQQWWTDVVEIGMFSKEVGGEWRDVPVEEEKPNMVDPHWPVIKMDISEVKK